MHLLNDAIAPNTQKFHTVWNFWVLGEMASFNKCIYVFLHDAQPTFGMEFCALVLWGFSALAFSGGFSALAFLGGFFALGRGLVQTLNGRGG